MKRRTFLAFLGLAPAAPIAARLPVAAPVARAADLLTYPFHKDYLGYLAEGARTTTWWKAPEIYRDTSAWTLSAKGDYIEVRGGRRIYRS